MHSCEFALLLHEALKNRVGMLREALAGEGWQGSSAPLRQVRIASRRARAALEMVDAKRYPDFRGQSRRLRGLTRALARTRDLDVQVERLEGLQSCLEGPEALGALEHLLERLAKRQSKARSVMERDLRHLSLKHLPRLLEVRGLRQDGALQPSDGLRAEVWAWLEPNLDSVFLLLQGLLGREDGPALHSLRIRLKRFRYSLEILAPAFATPPEAEGLQLKALQKALGSHHDISILESILSSTRMALLSRQRQTLARGTEMLMELLSEERAIAYGQFRALAAESPRESLRSQLKQHLALQEGNSIR